MIWIFSVLYLRQYFAQSFNAFLLANSALSAANTDFSNLSPESLAVVQVYFIVLAVITSFEYGVVLAFSCRLGADANGSRALAVYEIELFKETNKWMKMIQALKIFFIVISSIGAVLLMFNLVGITNGTGTDGIGVASFFLGVILQVKFHYDTFRYNGAVDGSPENIGKFALYVSEVHVSFFDTPDDVFGKIATAACRSMPMPAPIANANVQQ
jgi:hypothetical protein